jgi:hypothetical protein
MMWNTTKQNLWWPDERHDGPVGEQEAKGNDYFLSNSPSHHLETGEVHYIFTVVRPTLLYCYCYYYLLSNAHFRCSSPEKDGTLPTKCRERERQGVAAGRWGEKPSGNSSSSFWRLWVHAKNPVGIKFRFDKTVDDRRRRIRKINAPSWEPENKKTLIPIVRMASCLWNHLVFRFQ